MMRLYCIVAKTKSGKDYFLNSIMSDKKFIEKTKLKLFSYGTTKKLHHSSNNQKYYWVTKKEMNEIEKKNKFIDFRTYFTLTEGEVKYFTQESDMKSKEGNYICIATPYQYEMYKEWMRIQGILKERYELRMIYIDTPVKVRVKNIAKTVMSEDDLSEVCSRVIQERGDYERAKNCLDELKDPKNHENVCYIRNTNLNSEISRKYNVIKIKNFIKKTIKCKQLTSK